MRRTVSKWWHENCDQSDHGGGFDKGTEHDDVDDDSSCGKGDTAHCLDDDGDDECENFNRDDDKEVEIDNDDYDDNGNNNGHKKDNSDCTNDLQIS